MIRTHHGKNMNAERSAEFDKTYLKIAYVWATLSRAIRRKVGCIVVKDNMIISDGFNGTPIGFDNKCEQRERSGIPGRYITKPEVLHAESNAITKLANSPQSCAGATMYITISPCVECAKLIIQSDIKRVVYGEVYRDLDGVDLLEKASIITDKIDI